MPACSRSARARSWMRRLACRTSSASRCSVLVPSGRSCSKTSIAMREATSPAWAPPMPSATTNSGSRAKALSSLSRRWRPVSVLQVIWVARNIQLLEIAELRVSDPDPVAGMQRRRPVQRLVVQVGAVGGTEILDHEHVALARDASVLRGGEWVVELDLDVTASERGAVRELVGAARLVAGGSLDHEARI